MSAEAVGKFITAVMMHFPFKHESPAKEAEWTASMVRNLRGYDAKTLQTAAQDIIDRRTDRRFPLPAECKKTCDEIVKFQMLASPQLVEGIKPEYAKFSDWQYKLADDLIKCEMGRHAARGGWILSLHDFARKNGRLPQDYEVAQCKASAKGFDEAYETVLRGEGGMLGKSLEALGASMLARREKLSQMVEGQ